MSLQPGQMLAHYRVSKKIGEGGMGEVWKATDTNLDREVAIKILPESVAADSDRLARFSREAKLLAALNHPHIAAVYGLHQDGDTRFLAMEFMDGEDLTQRLARGPVSVNDAIEVADKVASALQEAHDKGIIHRDLKPANIMILADGGVKVLDFGLAKALSPESVGGSGLSDPSMSPTLTAAMGTQAGLIMGTAGYMSPEQARGKPLDQRCDVWAFGVVLYQMLAGERLFSGETATDVIAAVVTREPDWSKLPAATPAAVRRLLRRCLEKDPRRRLRDLGDARLDLLEADTASHEASEIPAGLREPLSRQPAWPLLAGGLVAGLVLAAILAFLFFPSPGAGPTPINEPPTWSNLLAPEGTALNFGGFVEISPDGRYVAFIGTTENGTQSLWLRDLASEEARPLRGTKGALMPFWSPDSRSIAYFAESKLRVIRIDGGVPTVLAPAGGAPRGGSWSADGTILFVPDWNDPVYRIPAAGGTPEPVTTFDESRLELSHRWPHALPDGRHFLYYIVSTYPELNPENPSEMDASGLYLGSLDGSPARLLLKARSRAIYSNESLLYVNDGILMSRPFDLAGLSFQGPAAPLAENVTQSVDALWGGALFSVSDEGSLILVRGAPEYGTPSQLTWRDRQGAMLSKVGKPGDYKEMRISPDGSHLAAAMGDPSDIWLVDFARDSFTRFSFDSGDDRSPAWSADGKRIIFMSSRVLADDKFTPAALFTRETSGLGEAVLLANSIDRFQVAPSDWSSDDRITLLDGSRPGTGSNILSYSHEDSIVEEILATKHDEYAARFSADGRWLLYESNESGQQEIYLQAYPLSGSKWQVSRDGGTMPTWRADGKEIFYFDTDKQLMSVPISTENNLRLETPVPLFQSNMRDVTGDALNYDVSPDGQRFLLMEPTPDLDAREATLTLVRNWPTFLASRAAQNRQN